MTTEMFNRLVIQSGAVDEESKSCRARCHDIKVALNRKGIISVCAAAGTALYGPHSASTGYPSMATTDDLEHLRMRLFAARRDLIARMAVDRDRAVPDTGLLRLTADIQTSLKALDAVYRDTSDLPDEFHEPEGKLLSSH